MRQARSGRLEVAGARARGPSPGRWTGSNALLLTVIGLALLVVNLGSPAPARTASANLVAAYSFDEGIGTTATDSSGNGGDGTINGASWTTQAQFGGALSFNGSSSFVDLGNPTSLRLAGSATWSAWVYATGNPPDDGQIIAKSEHGGGTGGWQLKTSPDTGPQTFAIAVSPDGNTETTRYSRTVRSLNTWYYVAGVYDASAQTLHIYVNGNLDDGVLRGTIPATQFDPARNAAVGRRSGGFYFQGTVDEVRVYNRALTQSEIQTDMNRAIVPPTAIRRRRRCRSARRRTARRCATP